MSREDVGGRDVSATLGGAGGGIVLSEVGINGKGDHHGKGVAHDPARRAIEGFVLLSRGRVRLYFEPIAPVAQ